jgi:hypothetical protein
LSPYAEVRERELEKLGYEPEPHARAIRFFVLAQTVDPELITKIRYQQKIRLARYGRQNVLQWDDVPLAEFLQYHEALAELIEAEDSTTRMLEDA